MTAVLTYFFQGLALGLSAGIAPGPLTALLVSETVRHGMRAGVKVALAPLVTDAPVVLLVLLVLSQLRDVDLVIGAISLAGALFLLKLGIDGLRFRGAEMEEVAAPPKTLRKAALVNLLNPNPWLFWTAVGGPLILKSAGEALPAPAGFLIAFYGMLVGAKMIMALLTGISRRAIQGRAYIWLNRLMGVLLLFFAALFLRDGLSALGLIS